MIQKIYEKIVTDIQENLNSNTTSKLTSNSSSTIINDQIKYFSFFVKKSIEYDDKNIILDILPWMYHAFNAQGFKYKYFLFLYDMWLLSAKKFLDDSTYENIDILFTEIKNNHEKIVNSTKSYITGIFDLPENFKEPMSKFKTTLLDGNSSLARNIFQEKVNNFKELQEFYSFIIYPSMVEIGKAWENGIITPAQEHLASSIVLETLTLLYTRLELPRIIKNKIIIGTVTNEFHEIGAIMLANALEAKGFDVEYLGCNISNEIFLLKIEELNPDIVALSVAMPFNLDNTSTLVSRIKEHNKDITVMVGGSAFNTNVLCEEKCGADIYLKDVDDAVKEAEYLYTQKAGE